MSYFLAPADVWGGLVRLGMVGEATHFATKMQELMTEGATKLAAAGDFQVTTAAMEETAFGGLLIVAKPSRDGQAIPPCIEGADDADEWGE